MGRTLLELDLRENEGLSGHEGEARRLCPALRSLDNKNLKTEGAGVRMDQLKLASPPAPFSQAALQQSTFHMNILHGLQTFLLPNFAAHFWKCSRNIHRWSSKLFVSEQASGAAASVADQNEDRGSCSCIEGNPCQSQYTCKDWAHRFVVAKHVMDTKNGHC